MCTETRYKQGANEIVPSGEYDGKHTREFIDWVVKDVLEEGQVEMEESELDPKMLRGLIKKQAACWWRKLIK